MGAGGVFRLPLTFVLMPIDSQVRVEILVGMRAGLNNSDRH